MGAIVLELQREALERSTKVTDLLRKALLVARKLKIHDFKEWINNEINGYSKLDQVPDYRIMSGQVKVWNPYRGWEQVLFEDPEFAELASHRHTSQAISEIEAMYESEGGGLMMPFPAATQNQFMDDMKYPYPPTLHVPKTQLNRVLDIVRNTVLNWSLKLEEDGILGDDLAFSPEEKDAAAKAVYNVTTFYGDVTQAQLQIDSNGASQTQVLQTASIEDISEFASKLKESLPEIEISEDQRDELIAETQTIEAQASSPKPKPKIIAESLKSIRKILEKVGEAAIVKILLDKIAELTV